MATENICPHCGKPVPPTALQGICPECMLKAGLSAETGEVGPGGTVLAKPPPQPVPRLAEIAPHFPQLEILECLGRGGMGAVYKARQPKLDRLVALKILTRNRSNGTTDTEFAERFQREARALARLNHPDIVAVYDFGEAGGYHYLLMEYVDGLTLRQLFQTRKLSPEEALTIVPMICEALQFAHERGIVHRDIKPENILLDKQGQVKIADFGIAKILGQSAQAALTQDKQVIGTPHYMAPEQVEKPATVDHRADIFSLGVVFYEMLTGELPLGKFQVPSRKVHVDVRLDEVVLHALEKEPDRRYQHASEVKTDVEAIAATPESSCSRREAAHAGAEQPDQSLLTSAATTERKRSLWRRAAVFATVVILLAIAAALANNLWPRSPGRGNVRQDIQSQPVMKSLSTAEEFAAAVPPVVVRTVPESGLADVDPALAEIQVTFSKDMMTDHMWAICQISEDTFPESAGQVHYLDDRRTCVMPVKLQPGKTYVLWFNRAQFNSFRDTNNNPSLPYMLIFETRK